MKVEGGMVLGGSGFEGAEFGCSGLVGRIGVDG